MGIPSLIRRRLYIEAICYILFLYTYSKNLTDFIRKGSSDALRQLSFLCAYHKSGTEVLTRFRLPTTSVTHNVRLLGPRLAPCRTPVIWLYQFLTISRVVVNAFSVWGLGFVTRHDRKWLFQTRCFSKNVGKTCQCVSAVVSLYIRWCVLSFKTTGPLIIIKTSSYGYRDPHHEPETIWLTVKSLIWDAFLLH